MVRACRPPAREPASVLVGAPLDDRDVDARQRQLARQHQSRRAASGDEHRRHQVTRPGAASMRLCSPRLDEAAQAVERVPDVGVAGVERGDAEADGVRAAEVGDDVRALDQRAADRPRVGVLDRDVGAADLRVAR